MKTPFSINLGGVDKSVEDIVKDLKHLREKELRDVSLDSYLKQHGESLEGFMGKIDRSGAFDGIPGGLDGLTVGKALTLDDKTRWLVPEIFLESIREGFLGSPIYNLLVAKEVQIDGLSAIIPTLPQLAVGQMLPTPELGVIRTGSLKYSSRNVSLRKYTAGLEFSDELIQYTPLDLVSIYFQDLGKVWGLQLDGLAIDTLINGDQMDGSFAADIVGVTTAGTLTYKDVVRFYVRASQIDKDYPVMLMNEDMALTFLDLPEVNRSQYVGAPKFDANLTNFRLPTAADVVIHPSVPANQIIFVNKSRALVKLNAQPLTVEGERIVRRQLEGRYASITTGFTNAFRDGRIIMDISRQRVPGGAYDFPPYFKTTALAS